MDNIEKVDDPTYVTQDTVFVLFDISEAIVKGKQRQKN